MTSETVLANQRSADAAPRAGHKADTSQEVENAPRPSNMNAHLESQTAICNRAKAAAANESAASREQASSIASKIELESKSLGCIPRNIRLHTLATSGSEPLQPLPAPLAGLSAKTVSPSHPPPSLPPDHRSRVSTAQTSAASCGKAARPDEGRRLLSVPRYSLLWQTVAIATSMLLFAAIRPSTTDATTTRGTDQSTGFAADSKESSLSASGRQPVTTSRTSKSPVATSSTGGMKIAEERRRQTDQRFVAEDFTNHFDSQTPNIATLQSSERNTRGSVKTKLIVVVD
jgi:hypothetical protein